MKKKQIVDHLKNIESKEYYAIKKMLPSITRIALYKIKFQLTNQKLLLIY